MPKILTLGEVAKSATDTLATFRKSKPDLIKTGLGPLDRTIGGLMPGQGGILALRQGVGKSSTIFSAAAMSEQRIGVISLEDTEDQMGTKGLSYASGINSLRIRRKDLTAAELKQLKGALEKLEESKALFVCHPGARIEQAIKYAEDMITQGARMVYLDYIQKIRGIRADRNNEVATAFTMFQGAVFEAGGACILASQFSRKSVKGEAGEERFRDAEPWDRPQLSWMKETGDLENEGRVIVLGWRNRTDANLVHYTLAKSAFGGEGLEWTMRRDPSGILREVELFPEEDW